MNVFYQTFRLILSTIFIILLAAPARSQVVFKASPVENAYLPELQEELSDYRVIHLDSRAILDLVQKNPHEIELIFSFNEDQNWHIRLQEDDIRTQSYQVQMQSEKGVQKITGSRAKTFAGQVLSPEGGACRLTLAEGFVYGLFEIGDETWFIEPAKRFDQDAGLDAYLLYNMKNVLPNSNGHCAAIELETIPIKTDQQKSVGECYAIEIALAADYQMLQLFGNVETLENYVLGILNNVHTNYDEEFEHTIRFKAVTLYISTCPTCDPWAPLTDYLQLLANFRDWSNGGGFEIIFDVATLWTGRVLDNNIGGGGYFGGLCSNQRYQVLRRYSANAGLMRALQAHELGHNLNARHDADGSPYIMAPRIQNVHEWSTFSKNTINTYFNGVVNAQNCVSACENLIAPQAAFITTATNGCAPFTVQFINQSAANANSWQWIFGEGLTSFDKNPVATFTAPGTYKVQLVAGNPIGFDTTETLIFVKGRPNAGFSINSTAGSAIIALTNNSTDAMSYLWQFGDGKTSTNANPTHIYTLDGNYTVTLIAQNECGNDTTTQSVNISTAPTADFSAQTTSGCASLAVQFQNNASANATTFEWQFPGGIPSSSTAQNPMITYLQPGVYKVILTVRNATGNAMITKNDFITVKGKPDAAFSFNKAENIVSFTNQSLDAQSYLWNFGDNSSSNSQNPVHSYSNPGTYAVQLIAINSCGNDTLQQNVTLSGAAPSASFNANIQEGCTPLMVQFSDLSNGNVSKRNWTFSGGNPSTSQAATPMITYAQPGSYSVTLIAENFWGKDTLTLPDYIEVLAQPDASFDFTVDGQEVTFQSNFSNPDWQYEWHFGDGTTSNALKPNHFYANSGEYKVELRVTNSCGTATSSATVTIVVTAATNIDFLDVFQLSPNPTQDYIELLLQGQSQKKLQARLINVLGQQLKHWQIDFSLGNYKEIVDCSRLTSGMYWLEIIGFEGAVSHVFIVQKQ